MARLRRHAARGAAVRSCGAHVYRSDVALDVCIVVSCALVAHSASSLFPSALSLGFFLFVVVGSSLLQIIKTATSGMPPA